MGKFKVGDVVIIFFQVRGDSEESSRLERDAGVVTKVSDAGAEWMFEVSTTWGLHDCDDYEIFHVTEADMSEVILRRNRKVLLEANKTALEQIAELQELLDERVLLQKAIAKELGDSRKQLANLKEEK